MEDPLHEINEILERKDFNDQHKAMISQKTPRDSTISSVRFSPLLGDAGGVIKKELSGDQNNSAVATQAMTPKSHPRWNRRDSPWVMVCAPS